MDYDLPSVALYETRDANAQFIGVLPVVGGCNLFS